MSPTWVYMFIAVMCFSLPRSHCLTGLPIFMHTGLATRSPMAVGAVCGEGYETEWTGKLTDAMNDNNE